MALHNQEIAERLRELRGSRPQTLVATEIGVSPRALQNWELAEARPSYRNVEKLAEFYGVAQEYILTGGRRSLARPKDVDENERPMADKSTVDERLARIEAALELAASERQQITDLLAQQTELLARMEAATRHADDVVGRLDEVARRAGAELRSGSAGRPRAAAKPASKRTRRASKPEHQ